MTDTHIPEHVDLELTGMTCAACAMRIEKKLNRLDGVTATVNYATEKASVTFDTALVQPDALVACAHASIKETGGRKHLLGPDCSINPGTPDVLMSAVGAAVASGARRS